MRIRNFIMLIFLLVMTIYFGGTLASIVYLENVKWRIIDSILLISLVLPWIAYIFYIRQSKVKKSEETN